MNEESRGPDECALGEQVSDSKRRLLKQILASMTVYSVPLMASFSMEGLRIGTAEAQTRFTPPGTVVANQFAPDGAPLPIPPGQPQGVGDGHPPAEPFTSNQPPPGKPFIFVP